MNTDNLVEASQHLESILDQAAREGEIRIRSKDGRIFTLRPESVVRSPLDIEGVELGLSAAEIVALVREGRER